MSRETVPAPQDQHATLRERLALHVLSNGTGALGRIAGRAGLTPDAVAAFVGGSHIAEWAAARLGRVLDQDQLAREGKTE